MLKHSPYIQQLDQGATIFETPLRKNDKPCLVLFDLGISLRIYLFFSVTVKVVWLI